MNGIHLFFQSTQTRNQKLCLEIRMCSGLDLGSDLGLGLVGLRENDFDARGLDRSTNKAGFGYDVASLANAHVPTRPHHHRRDPLPAPFTRQAHRFYSVRVNIRWLGVFRRHPCAPAAHCSLQKRRPQRPHRALQSLCFCTPNFRLRAITCRQLCVPEHRLLHLPFSLFQPLRRSLLRCAL